MDLTYVGPAGKQTSSWIRIPACRRIRSRNQTRMGRQPGGQAHSSRVNGRPFDSRTAAPNAPWPRGDEKSSDR